MIDLEKLNSYKENSNLEAKKAAGGLPHSIWQTALSMPIITAKVAW